MAGGRRPTHAVTPQAGASGIVDGGSGALPFRMALLTRRQGPERALATGGHPGSFRAARDANAGGWAISGPPTGAHGSSRISGGTVGQRGGVTIGQRGGTTSPAAVPPVPPVQIRTLDA